MMSGSRLVTCCLRRPRAAAAATAPSVVARVDSCNQSSHHGRTFSYHRHQFSVVPRHNSTSFPPLQNFSRESHPTSIWYNGTGRRFLSTASSKPTTEEELTRQSEQFLKRGEIYNEVGSWKTLAVWQDVVDLIRLWTTLETTVSNSTTTSTTHAILLTRRMAKELQAHPQHEKWLSRVKRADNLLVLVVQHWKEAWTIQPNKWTANKVLAELKEWRQNSHGQLVADIYVYNLIMESYLAVKRQEDPLQAAKFLQTTLDHMAVKPNTRTYEIVMEAWLDAQQLNKAIEVMAVILQDNKHVRFGPAIFERALQTCVDTIESKDAGRLADIILELMHKLYAQGLLSIQPHQGHFNQVILAWAKARDPRRSVPRAKELLRHLETHGPSTPALKPDIWTYHAVLQTLGRCGQLEQAEQLMTWLLWESNKHHKTKIVPDTPCFGTVLDGWSRSKLPNAGERAEALLRKLLDLSRQNKKLQPDVMCYNSVMQAYISAQHPEAGNHVERLYQELKDDAKLQPTLETYSTLIHAWAWSGEVDQAANILMYLCDEFQNGNNNNVPAPDVQCFNILLNAYAQSRNVIAGQEAQRLLQKMWELCTFDNLTNKFTQIRPNHVSYSSTINAWAQSGHANAGEEAEALLQDMISKANQLEDSTLQPTTITYNSVMNAWAKCGNYERAKHIFSNVMPRDSRTVATYNALLDALSRTTSAEEKGEVADACLLAMTLRGVVPDKITYMMVHKCWHLQSLTQPHPQQQFVYNDDVDMVAHYENNKPQQRMDVLKSKIEAMENNASSFGAATTR